MSQQVQQGSKPQLNLPGQSSVAEGPRDHSGMYIMHYAFRRDLANFTSAVQGTPLGDRDVWEAMAARWLRFVGVLHHHHSAEDTYYWPVLREAAAQRGTGADAQILDAMEDEHAGIDPSLAACTAAFDAVVDHPCEDHRNALAVRLAALREMLAEHLRHEETEALALVQRVVTAQEFAQIEKGVSKAYPLRSVPFLVPWSTYGLPPEMSREFFAEAGPVYALLHRISAGRFARREHIAFRYSDTPAL